MITYESSVKTVSLSPQATYGFLSDLSNLKQLRLLPGAFEQLKGARFDTDSCRLEITGLGSVGFRIVERVPCRTIRLESEGLPMMTIAAQVQLEQTEEGGARMQLILHADLPSVLHTMMGGRLQEGVERAAEAIARALDGVDRPPAE